VLKRLASIEVPAAAGDFRLVSRQALAAFTALRDRVSNAPLASMMLVRLAFVAAARPVTAAL
jgi:hypothetical protein